MSDRSPIIAFGLKAATVALKAKCGSLRLVDKYELAMACLEWMGDDPKVREAVVAFSMTVDENPIAASDMLQAAISRMVPEVEPKRGEEVLAEIESEGEGYQFLWQTRKDCQ